MKFRLFSPTQGETIAEAKVFFQTNLPWYLGELDAQALAYVSQCWTADTVNAPFQYNVVAENGETIRTLLLDKHGARWPW